jgi:hypothetical protein
MCRPPHTHLSTPQHSTAAIFLSIQEATTASTSHLTHTSKAAQSPSSRCTQGGTRPYSASTDMAAAPMLACLALPLLTLIISQAF